MNNSDTNTLNNDKKRFIPSIRLFTIELLSVILGVLLALMLNRWSESITTNKKVEIALTNIANEISANSAILKKAHEQNALVFQPNDSTNNERNDTFTPAIQIQDTAWETFLSTDLSTNIDYELLLLLSQVYSVQDLYKSFGSNIIESYLNTTALTILLGDDKKEELIDDQIKENFQLVYNVEEPLLELYEDSLISLATIQIHPNN